MSTPASRGVAHAPAFEESANLILLFWNHNRRDEKRYQEKKNKAERDRKKKEDNTRRRTMIDTALALDPRIKAFRAAEKAAREAKRKGGVANGGAAVDPKVKAEEERKAKEEAEKAAADQAAKDASDKVRFLHKYSRLCFHWDCKLLTEGDVSDRIGIAG